MSIVANGIHHEVVCSCIRTATFAPCEILTRLLACFDLLIVLHET